MSAPIKSPSGKILQLRATRTTTPSNDSEAKKVKVKLSKEQRLAENREALKNANVQAFLKAIADAERGGYDFKYGALKGRRNDPWRFTDYSTHPGPGSGGVTTAAGCTKLPRRPGRITVNGGWTDGLYARNPRSDCRLDLARIGCHRKNQGW